MNSTIRFFHTGNGDTALIQSNGDWALIDANLVKHRKVKERVLEALGSTPRLRLLCVTHFDLDHIRGLADFLIEHFSEPDGFWPDGSLRRRYRIDQVITPLQEVTMGILTWLRKVDDLRPLVEGDVSREVGKLLGVLCDICAQRSSRAEILSMSPRTELPWPESAGTGVGLGSWRCWCLGPKSRTLEVFNRQIEESYRYSLPTGLERVEANEVSRVFALVHEPTGHVVFLPGDSTPPEIDAALREWKRAPPNIGTTVRDFNTVKASHHGAASCHVADLYHIHTSPPPRLVIISAENDGDHPHLDVIKFLKKHGFAFRVTGPPQTVWRKRQRRKGLLPGVARTIADDDQDITLSFPDGLPTWTGGRTTK